MSDLLKAALEYIKHGLSVIATGEDKVCVLPSWTQFQKRIPTEEEVESMFRNKNAKGIAIICGAVSGGGTAPGGGLECIDIDCKYDLTGSMFEDFMQLVADYSPSLAASLPIASTVNIGNHIYYRCDKIEGNKPFARRPVTEEEKKNEPHLKYKVLTESRGEHGYIMATPTKGYKFIQGNAFTIPKITVEDREALINIAKSFNLFFEEEYKPKSFNHDNINFNKSPFDDYNERGDVIALLVKHGWVIVRQKGDRTIFKRPGDTKSKTSGDYHRGLGLFAVFTTSSQFQPNKGYRPASVYILLECNGDAKLAYKKLLAEGFGEPYKKIQKEVRQFIRKEERNGVEGEELIESVAKQFSYTTEDAAKIIEKIEATRQKSQYEFWSWDEEKEKINIIYNDFARFLERIGFGLFMYDTKSTVYRLVQNKNNLLEEVTSEVIKKATMRFVEDYNLDGVDYTKGLLKETIIRNNNIFSENLFEYLERMDVDFLKDTKDECFIPFLNGIVKITADSIQLLKHGDVNKVIWRNDLINSEVEINQSDDTNCEFLDFIYKVMAQNEKRVLRLISLLGYAMHKYKDPSKPYVLIIAEENDDDKKGGGTGKGILVEGLSRMSNTVPIDGKNFDINSPFAWQRIELETKLVVIDDALKNFPFEKLYSIVTTGLPVNKKNKREFFMPYTESPKILITTNYSVSDEGVHAKRRQQLIEFSNYFNADRTPIDEYGHLLFDDWDKGEWNRFYNFMFYCIQFYLQRGVIKGIESDLYKHKKIKNTCGEPFLMWYLDYVANGCEKWKPTAKMHDDFLETSGLDKKDYNTTRFGLAMKTAAEVLGYTYKTERHADESDNNKRKTMGITEKGKATHTMT